MDRRQIHPILEFSISLDDLYIKVSSDFGSFVATLNLKAIKDAIRQRTNSAIQLVARTTKYIFSRIWKFLVEILGRCLRKSIEIVFTLIFVTLFIFIGSSILKWFVTTPLAHNFGITLDTNQILLILDKVIDLVL